MKAVIQKTDVQNVCRNYARNPRPHWKVNGAEVQLKKMAKYSMEKKAAAADTDTEKRKLFQG